MQAIADFVLDQSKMIAGWIGSNRPTQISVSPKTQYRLAASLFLGRKQIDVCFLYKFSPFSFHEDITFTLRCMYPWNLCDALCFGSLKTCTWPWPTNSKIYVSIVGHVWSLLIWSIHRPFACECEKCLAFPKSKALAAYAIWPWLER